MKNTYLVICTSFFGDTLLTSSLVQNIKNNDKDAEIIFILNKPFAILGKFLDRDATTLAYDKRGKHKGLLGIYKFYKEHNNFFKGKNLVASFVIYGNERGILLSKLLGFKKIYSENSSIFKVFLSNAGKIEKTYETKMIDFSALLYKAFNEENFCHYPMNLSIPIDENEESTIEDKLLKLISKKDFTNLICLCPISKKKAKDLPLDFALEIIKTYKNQGKTVILLGAGEEIAQYDQMLQKENVKYISLVNKTTLAELAYLLKKVNNLISVDTGTMHLALGLHIPTTSLFFVDDKEHMAKWAPKKEDYPCNILTSQIDPETIVRCHNTLLNI